MNQQKRTNLWKTRHKILLGLLVCALVLSAVLQRGSFKAQADPFDETKAVSLTVTFSESIEKMQDMDPDIPKADWVLDLDPNVDETKCVLDVYKIASAGKVPGYDTYSYTKLEGFESLDLEKKKTVDGEEVLDWETIQEDAAKLILAANSTIKPVNTGLAIGEEISKDEEGKDLHAGLYMVVLRGTTNYAPDWKTRLENNAFHLMTDKAEYVGTETRGEGETAETITVTKAVGRSRIYSFQPALISLPDKDYYPDQATGDKNTAAQNGDWIYEQSIALKATSVPKVGKLSIRKDFTGDYFSPCTVVFSLEFDVPDAGYEIPNMICSMNFNTAAEAAAGKEIEVKVYDEKGEERGIPVYTIVTVTEVYAGAGYSQVSVVPEDGVIKILADEMVNVSFVNTLDHQVHGYGIINHFVNDGEGGWIHSVVEEN